MYHCGESCSSNTDSLVSSSYSSVIVIDEKCKEDPWSDVVEDCGGHGSFVNFDGEAFKRNQHAGENREKVVMDKAMYNELLVANLADLIDDLTKVEDDMMPVKKNRWLYVHSNT